MSGIHVIGRALIINNSHILVCRFSDNTYYFLPGGQVEYNEDVRSAIKREMIEECGGTIELSDFVGVIEHTFPQNGQPFHEYSLVFTGHLEGYKPPVAPRSLEENLHFCWLPLEELTKADLKPPPLSSMISDYVRTGLTGRWATTMTDDHLQK